MQKTRSKAHGARSRLDALLAGYQPLPGVLDEMVDADGKLRAHWAPLVRALAEHEPEALAARFSAADRHLRDSGVSYRVYGDPQGERPWPLSHLPLIVAPDEWHQIETGLTQRARLLEAVLRDVYGPCSLVAHGAIPAAVIAGSPEFLRPLHGVKPQGGRFLHFYAADLGRGPDGRWWVLNDRAQAPSGAGYALENRIALSRALPEIVRGMNVQRLAGFFQRLRANLAALTRRDEYRIGLLTPGPLNETYFEHAYLARYLGLMLVEGSDLAVHDRMVYVRTIEGLKRIDVLMRRLDADFCDPLELNPASQLGVPGLVQAVRNGSVLLANALGAGFVETRALLGFLPRLAQRVLGEDLMLPNVATWWCGQASERDTVLAQFDALAIAPAFPQVEAGTLAPGGTAVSEMAPERREQLAQAIRTRGADYVGQELVRLSTMPVHVDGRLVARPFTVRVYLAAADDGWVVMPGGFCRVSEREDARAISMQRGGSSADVWVAASAPVEAFSLLPTPDHVPIRRSSGYLPSRAADNLYWLGRYIQRTEMTLRIAQSLGERLLEPEVAAGASGTVDRLADMLVSWSAAPGGLDDAAQVLRETMTGHSATGAVPLLAQAARRDASVVRDRLSPEAWRALVDLAGALVRDDPSGIAIEALLERSDSALRTMSAFVGLLTENMNRGAGWRFMQIGRRLERAILTCRLTRVLGSPAASATHLDALLGLVDGLMTYRARYLVGTLRVPVLDLVLLDLSNPRSVAFQVDRIANHLIELPGHRPQGLPGELERQAFSLRAETQTAAAEQVTPQQIARFESVLMTVSDLLSMRDFTQRAPGRGDPELLG
ncbi:MAG: circularly permuted type 2 ATP-grasp protein [Burkholderiales bacterium]|nr:MAG: circularly permuted type 2 ATP-grasp protein [Burkholderiales bacterium]